MTFQYYRKIHRDKTITNVTTISIQQPFEKQLFKNLKLHINM